MNVTITRLILIAGCLLVVPSAGTFGIARAQSSLPECPSDTGYWDNCFGLWSNEDANLYPGEWHRRYAGEFHSGKFHGQGLYTFENGDEYVGEFENDQLNGNFQVNYANGDKFSGSYRSDKRDGDGTYYWRDGSKYVGQWRDGKPTNDGVFTNGSGEVVVGLEYERLAVYQMNSGSSILPDALSYSEGTIQQQQVTQTTSGQPAQSSLRKCPKGDDVWTNCFGKWSNGDGITYEGEWQNNEQNGQGTTTFADGSKYVGEFKDNKRNGQGTYTFADGSKYVGEFKDDKAKEGTRTFPTGDTYVGEFKDDKFNGQGTYTYASGDKYVGEFKDNKINGQISVLYSNADSFVGLYVADKRSGQGSYDWKDGSNYRGQWKDGLPTDDGILTNSTGATITGAQYKSSAVYDAEGYMTSPDVLTYSGGTVQQQIGAYESVEAPQQSSLPKCDDKLEYWNNCFGKRSGDLGEGFKFTYEGEWRDNKKNGRGTDTFENGDSYVGEFKGDAANGQGTYTYLNHWEYIGEFKDYARNGFGTLKTVDGESYVGEFRNDMFNGQGTWTFADGSKYVGEFKDNKFNSQFTVSYANGDSFSGGYQSDKRAGQGTYTWNDGSKYVGQWKDGLPTTDGILTNTSGSVITGAQYRSSAVYANDSGMTSPDVLTYSGGTVQQQTVAQTPAPQQQSITTNDSLRKVALIIGNGAYENAPQLANPKNDATAMAEMLSSLGFKVIIAVDAKKSDMESSIRGFLRDARSSDLSLFFYSGHGIEVGGENFLLPIDARLEEEAALNFEVINSKVITNTMGGDKQIGIILLDACRDNPFTKSLKRSMIASRAATVSDGLAPISSDGGGLVVAFATAPGDTASDGEGANSPFTTALLKWMPERGLEIELMMKKVKSEVSTITNNDQRPWTNSDLTTEVYLAGQ